MNLANTKNLEVFANLHVIAYRNFSIISLHVQPRLNSKSLFVVLTSWILSTQPHVCSPMLEMHSAEFSLYWNLFHYARSQESSAMKAYVNTLNYIDLNAEQIPDLMFDRAMYKACRQVKFWFLYF